MGPTTSDLVLFFSGLFALLPVLICYGCRWWLDRGYLEPPWIFPVLFVGGGLGGLIFATWGFGSVELWYGMLYGGDLPTEPLFRNALLAPTAEELGKAFILLPLLVTRWYRGPVDGLIYGFAAGAGFACIESFMFFAQAFEEAGPAGWVLSVLSRAGPAAIVHGCCTAAVGAFLGFAYFDGRPWVVAGAILTGFVAAIFGHGLWNWFIWIAQITEDIRYEQIAMLLLPLFIIGFAVALSIAQRVEMHAIRHELATEIVAGRLTEEELDILVDRPRRREPEWWPIGSARQVMIATMLKLGFALHRYSADLSGTAYIGALRRRLRRFRRADRIHREASRAEALAAEESGLRFID